MVEYNRDLINEEILTPEIEQEAIEVLINKFEMYDKLLEKESCLYCDKEMAYYEITGYQYRGNDGSIDGIICEKEECKEKAESDENYATWEESRSGWPIEDKYWGVHDELLEFIVEWIIPWTIEIRNK